MDTVYVLLLLAVLLIIVFLTWGPLSKTVMDSPPKARRIRGSDQGFTRSSRTVELHPLDYSKFDARANPGAARK
jgi:hypothetical protein